jgi:hypothetical protein
LLDGFALAKIEFVAVAAVSKDEYVLRIPPVAIRP